MARQTPPTMTKKKPVSKKSAATAPPRQLNAKKSSTPPGTRPPKLSKAQLAELVEEATVDAYGESEQAVGFLTMIEHHVEVPFAAEVLGVPVRVTRFDVNDGDEIVAMCKRGTHAQRIPVVDLHLPSPPPEGFEWIEAYRLFRRRS